MRELTKRDKIGIIVLIALLIFSYGLLRVYYGGGIGLKVVPKHSFSFKDTIVNLDDLIGQPRIVFAAQHPAVKRQLEDMGYLETDEEARESISREAERNMRKTLRQLSQ